MTAPSQRLSAMLAALRGGDVTVDRMRTIVLLVVLMVWVVVVGATLVQGKLPDVPLLGIPGGVYLALYPPTFGFGNRAEPPADPPVEPGRAEV